MWTQNVIVDAGKKGKYIHKKVSVARMILGAQKVSVDAKGKWRHNKVVGKKCMCRHKKVSVDTKR